MESIPGISLGAAAFWIALAAVLIAGGWHKFRREQLKQETLLKLVERTGQLDAEQVKLLFPPPPPPHESAPWHPPPDPLEAQRGLRVGGTIVMGLAAGVAVLGLVLRVFGTGQQQDEWGIAFLGIAGVIAGLAVGLLVASKFATGPAPRGEHD
jgi:hypothetical protein